MTQLPARSEIRRAICTFRAGPQLYGIDVSALQEISTNTTITPVPPSPAPVRGLTNLRSRVLLVVDFRTLVGLPCVECTPDSRLLVFKRDFAADVAILADRGGDIVHVESHPFETRDVTGEADSIVTAVYKLQRELLMMVDVARVIERVGQAIQGGARDGDSRAGKELSREVNS